MKSRTKSKTTGSIVDALDPLVDGMLIVENLHTSKDAEGRPPLSVEVVIDGNVSDDRISRALFNNSSLATNFVGGYLGNKHSGTVKKDTFEMEISFSRTDDIIGNATIQS